ncbi:glycoside hydrolase family 3 C-terminal domain-containing protein [Stenotrophomonas maltophilia]|uniref:glycoside hydrolase family 3 C-terminal domain-containing protein n=1 Tax=Stenotrophomonas maltophilia TaxID=40324 RepID=UPI001EDAF0F1
MLLNNRDNVLPLQKTGQKIALIGPFVQDRENIEGCWTLFATSSATWIWKPACAPPSAMKRCWKSCRAASWKRRFRVAPKRPWPLHCAPTWWCWHWRTGSVTAVKRSRAWEITLRRPQQALAEAVAMTGKPLVVLLRNGRALALQGAVRNAHAVAVTGPGHADRPCRGDVLFGDYSPSGRLPVSFPQVSGQQPYFYNHPRTGRPELPTMSEFKARWREIPNEPLYPFGHGHRLRDLCLRRAAAERGPAGLGRHPDRDHHADQHQRRGR